MMEPVRDGKAMIAGMDPVIAPGEWVFVCLLKDGGAAESRLVRDAVGTFREVEGLSLILPRATALAEGFSGALPMRCITLRVHSALDGVGLTAAVAHRLAGRGIACNMVAAYHHDHAFVPADRAEEALATLRDLARQTQADV